MALQAVKTMQVQPEPTLKMKLSLKPQPPTQKHAGGGPPSFRMQNIRIDPSRALEPARKKLTTVEAQRVMAVFDETIKRCEIVTLLPYIMKNLDRYRVSLGSELVELIKHHEVVISSYDEIRVELDQQLARRAAEEEAAQIRAEEEGKMKYFTC